jgi:hypothetical protein
VRLQRVLDDDGQRQLIGWCMACGEPVPDDVFALMMAELTHEDVLWLRAKDDETPQ